MRPYTFARLTVPCFKCRVGPGEKCLTKSGTQAKDWVHKVRWQTAAPQYTAEAIARLTTGACESCGAPFASKPHGYGQRFCSDYCRVKTNRADRRRAGVPIGASLGEAAWAQRDHHALSVGEVR